MAEEKNHLSKISVGDKEIFIEDEEARQDIKNLKNPTFDDSGSVTGIASFPNFLSRVKTKMDIFGFFRDFAAGMKFVLHAGQLVNNCTSDRTDLPLAAKQGKILEDENIAIRNELAKLNSDLNFVLEENILSYATSDNCKTGFSSGTFPGANYAYSEELPDSDIKYGTWEINKRTKNTITVKLFSPYKSTMWINAYVNTYGWRGWQQFVSNSDIGLIRINTDKGDTFKNALNGRLNCTTYLAFAGDPTDNPFSFRNGFAIAFHSGLLYGPTQFALIGINQTCTTIETHLFDVE